jgi:hypothetical protein
MSTKSPDFGQQVAEFLTSLSVPVSLPQDVGVLQPYTDSEVCRVVRQMCQQFYQGGKPRLALWGINPGRFGAGLTGLSFTDPHAVRHCLQIESTIHGRREISAEFIQLVIEAYGGPSAFYRDVYLSALSPLGFMQGEKNLNFYDSTELQSALTTTIQHWVLQQITFGLRQDATVVLGTGKLKAFFEQHVRAECGFDSVVFLEHPRFIMQYRRKHVDSYVEKYVQAIRSCAGL